jgi:hypothetical protein
VRGVFLVLQKEVIFVGVKGTERHAGKSHTVEPDSNL